MFDSKPSYENECSHTSHRHFGGRRIAENFQKHMKRDKHTYLATIELEYNTPPGSRAGR